MPGHRAPRVAETNRPFPLKSLIRDRRSGRYGILFSYGNRGARVRFSATAPDSVHGTEWVRIIDLDAVTQEQIDAIVHQFGGDLV